MNSNHEYWDEFYSKWSFGIPSQFAALIAGEYLNESTTLVDLGCGNGRDTKFFSNLGVKVFASDKSKVAINQLKLQFQGKDNEPILDVVDYGDPENFQSYLQGLPQNSGRLFYARFLLHSLEPQTLRTFLATLRENSKFNDYFAFEYRTKYDNRLTGKTGSDHYRRGLDEHEILSFFSSGIVDIKLAVQGFGFAVFGSDDAHVGRLVFRFV